MNSANDEFPRDELDVLGGEDLTSTVESGDSSGHLDFVVDRSELVVSWTARGTSPRRTEMMRYDPARQLLRIFPLAVKSQTFASQFKRINELQIESPRWDPYDHSAISYRFGALFAVGLPTGFNAIYAGGLGIHRKYQSFVQLIEDHTACTTLRFTTTGIEGIDADGITFRVSLARFEKYRAAVDRNDNRARTAASRVNDAEAHNSVASLLNLSGAEVKYGRNPVIQRITEEVATGHVITDNDREALVQQLTSEAPAVARQAPRKFSQLRSDIELVSLETLIERFERDLAGSFANNEKHWQEFFDLNRFALQQLFSMPIVVTQREAHVQGADITGAGARIVDFLCANTVTRTAITVEIKTPNARLMEKNPYRGAGSAAVYATHKDLSGAVAQLHSQMSAIPKNLPQQLDRLPADRQVDPWNEVRGALIVGTLSSLSDEQRASLLRYRAGLSHVTILGYDEVLERLKGLHSMLRQEHQSPTSESK